MKVIVQLAKVESHTIVDHPARSRHLKAMLVNDKLTQIERTVAARFPSALQSMSRP